MVKITRQCYNHANGGSYLPQEETWSVFGKVPIQNPWEIVCLTASENDLDIIRKTFTGIPMHTGPIVTWHGPIAEFIAAHLYTKETT